MTKYASIHLSFHEFPEHVFSDSERRRKKPYTRTSGLQMQTTQQDFTAHPTASPPPRVANCLHRLELPIRSLVLNTLAAATLNRPCPRYVTGEKKRRGAFGFHVNLWTRGILPHTASAVEVIQMLCLCRSESGQMSHRQHRPRAPGSRLSNPLSATTRSRDLIQMASRVRLLLRRLIEAGCWQHSMWVGLIMSLAKEKNI